MTMLPKHSGLYAREIDRKAWATFDKQLRRARARGDAGEYVRIPIAKDRLLIVSEAEIGPSIDSGTVASLMNQASVEWGSITSSKGWRFVKNQAPEGFVDEGIVSRPEWWVRADAHAQGLDVAVTDDTTDYGKTTDEQHAELRKRWGVKSDAEYYADLRGRAHGASLARMVLAGRRHHDWEVVDVQRELRAAGITNRRAA